MSTIILYYIFIYFLQITNPPQFSPDGENWVSALDEIFDEIERAIRAVRPELPLATRRGRRKILATRQESWLCQFFIYISQPSADGAFAEFILNGINGPVNFFEALGCLVLKEAFLHVRITELREAHA